MCHVVTSLISKRVKWNINYPAYSLSLSHFSPATPLHLKLTKSLTRDKITELQSHCQKFRFIGFDLTRESKMKHSLPEKVCKNLTPLRELCNYCPLTFSTLENRVEHERMHKEKPFECVYCEMRFSYQLSLNRHIKIHK